MELFQEIYLPNPFVDLCACMYLYNGYVPKRKVLGSSTILADGGGSARKESLLS